MGLTQAHQNSVLEFRELTVLLLRQIAEAARSPCASVCALLEQNSWYVPAALEQATPLPSDNAPYSRKIIYSSGLGEAMVARWHSGKSCSPHDHGDARGVVTVLKGQFFEQAYTHQRSLRKVGKEQPFGLGAFHGVVPGEVHSMRAAEEGVTLHLYAPPAKGMKIYDEASGSIYTVADNCGAWVPADRSLILRSEPLGSNSLHY